MELDTRLEATRGKLLNLVRKHEDLKERLSRDSDKMIFERLLKEFEIARSTRTEEIWLDEEQWNDGLIATIREKVHMEAERKAMPNQLGVPSDLQPPSRVTYRINNKVVCSLEGARIGIQYETFFSGEPSDVYHCVLESKSFLEKMTVIEHTIPFFLPVKEAESDFLSSNAIKFVDYVGEMVQSYVERREQVRFFKELYGDRVKELFHNLPYNLIEFVVEDFYCKISFSLRYANLSASRPSRATVLAWPVHPSKKIYAVDGSSGAQSAPSRLPYAEAALTAHGLSQAFAEVVLSLPHALKQTFPFL